MEQIKLTPLNEIVDEVWGVRGTPERDAMESQLKEDIHACRIGEAIKQARQSQNMTQDQLAELMGVKKAQVSRIERGNNPTLSTITRAFRALGMNVSLNCGDMHIALV